MLKAANAPHVDTHGVRHRSTTDMTNSGVPTQVGMKLTGHKAAAMFMQAWPAIATGTLAGPGPALVDRPIRSAMRAQLKVLAPPPRQGALDLVRIAASGAALGAGAAIEQAVNLTHQVGSTLGCP